MKEPTLGPAIDGTRRQWRPAPPGSELPGELPGVAHVCCYAADRPRGRPLVLVHDLRSTSSAREMRPLFESFRWRRPTFALDLPGFGLSDRPACEYSPALYATVLAELLRKVRAQHASADVVALGRGSEALARVAAEEHGLVRSVALLEPSGLLSAGDATLEAVAARLALSCGDGAARALFALMTTRRWLRRTLRSRFHGAPDAALLDYAHASAQVEGAHHAPLSTLALGRAHLDLARLYHAITVPTMVIHDARGNSAVELEAFLRGRANRFAVRLSPTRGMPQFERRTDTVSTLERFWQSLSGAAWEKAMR
jgi:pimeloyl-ACP methyl ester carboxylesterase